MSAALGAAVDEPAAPKHWNDGYLQLRMRRVIGNSLHDHLNCTKNTHTAPGLATTAH